MKPPSKASEKLESSKRPPFTIEFYEDAEGNSAVYRWLTEELEEPLAKALGISMKHILQAKGAAVVETRYGKALGAGLYEFRLDESLDEVLRKLGLKRKKRLETAPANVLLRVFFHVHGDRLILLLGGYNKSERTAKSYQQNQISLARKRLEDWKQRNADARKPLKKGRGSPGG